MTDGKTEERLEPGLWAHAFKTAFCGSPTCGLHVVALREDNSPICEIVMSPEQTSRLVVICLEELENKAMRLKL
jgi:hypothetical protein